jgi:hypothetical protein
MQRLNFFQFCSRFDGQTPEQGFIYLSVESPHVLPPFLNGYPVLHRATEMKPDRYSLQFAVNNQPHPFTTEGTETKQDEVNLGFQISDLAFNQPRDGLGPVPRS